jgi:hypothetical protein
MKKGVVMFVAGVAIGYCLVQGFTYFQQNYLWALFYR